MSGFEDADRWVKCDFCGRSILAADPTDHMGTHGYDLRDEIANAEVVDLTGEPT